MRSIYKTTTALAACLTLIAPQIAAVPALAQADESPLPLRHAQTEAQNNGDQPDESAAPIPQDAKKAEQPVVQQQQDQPQAEDVPPQVQQAEPQAAEVQPLVEEQPQTEQAQPQPEPTQPQVEQPSAAPDSAVIPAVPEPRAQQPVATEKPPQAAPRSDAKAPEPRPAQAAEEAARAAAEQQAHASPPSARPHMDESAIRRALEQTAPEQPAPRPKAEAQAPIVESQPPAVAEPKAQAPVVEVTPGQQPGGQAPAPRPMHPSPDTAAQAEVTPGSGARPVDRPAVEPADPGNPADMRRILEEQAKGAPAAVEEVAPETRATPNDVATRAAEEVSPMTAAALEAGAAATGQVQETAITPDNIRSSDQDFRNQIGQPVVETTRENEARKDKNDHLGDIAKLLLSGAAGMAVGSMLGNDRQVALNTGDRVVVSLPDGSQQVIRDDNALLYQPGSNVQTETFDDGSTRTTVRRADGSRVVTIRDANLKVLRRTLIDADGQETRLINDTQAQPVQISTLPAPPPVKIYDRPLNEAELRAALNREAAINRRFSLSQIRDIPEVRSLVAPVDIPSITFDTGSAAITPDQARQLSTLGNVIKDAVASNPRELFMIEGYTDAIGSPASSNLAISPS